MRIRLVSDQILHNPTMATAAKHRDCTLNSGGEAYVGWTYRSPRVTASVNRVQPDHLDDHAVFVGHPAIHAKEVHGRAPDPMRTNALRP